MKKFTLIVLIICSITISFAFFQVKKPKYENLKILPKDINKQQMDSVMRHFSASLGVKCNFCHVRAKDEKKDFIFASDESEHKIIARNMFKMMNKLNKKYFRDDYNKNIQALTCYSCHNGKEHPETKPPMPQRPPAAPPAKS